jgi:hypothetical protein
VANRLLSPYFGYSSLPKLRHWVFHAIQNMVRDRLVWPARLKFRFPFPGQRIGTDADHSPLTIINHHQLSPINHHGRRDDG